MKKHTILFVAANPRGTDQLALDREAHAIQGELESSGHRDQIELVTRWAAEPLDLLRELRRLRPTVVHFSGHGQAVGSGGRSNHGSPQRDASDALGDAGGPPLRGLYFQASDGSAQVVPAAALEQTFGAAGSSVRLVVLSACYSEPQAAALLARVDCVIGTNGALVDDDARNFAIGFYGGLGDGESIAAAFEQGRAAISLAGPSSRDHLRLMARAGIDPSSLVLARAQDQRRDRGRPDGDQPQSPAEFSARGILTSAIAAVPAMRYALGVGGLGAVVSLMLVGLALDPITAVVGALVVVAFMVVLFVFSRLAATKASFRWLTTLMAWGFSFVAFASTCLLVSCFFFDTPKTIPCLIASQCAPPRAPAAAPGAPVVHGEGSGQAGAAPPPDPVPVRASNQVASPLVPHTVGDVNISYGAVEQTIITSDVARDARGDDQP